MPLSLPNRAFSHLSFFHLGNSYSVLQVQLRHHPSVMASLRLALLSAEESCTYPCKTLNTLRCPQPQVQHTHTHTHRCMLLKDRNMFTPSLCSQGLASFFTVSRLQPLVSPCYLPFSISLSYFYLMQQISGLRGLPSSH